MREDPPRYLVETPPLVAIDERDLPLLPALTAAVYAVPFGSESLRANQVALRQRLVVAIGHIKRLHGAAERRHWLRELRAQLTIPEPLDDLDRAKIDAAWSAYRSSRSMELDSRRVRPNDPGYAAWLAEDAAVAQLATVDPLTWRNPLLDLVDEAERSE